MSFSLLEDKAGTFGLALLGGRLSVRWQNVYQLYGAQGLPHNRVGCMRRINQGISGWHGWRIPLRGTTLPVLQREMADA